MSNRVIAYFSVLGLTILSAGVLVSQTNLHRGIADAGRASQNLDYDNQFTTALLDAKSGYVELLQAFGLVLETMQGEITPEDLEVQSTERLLAARVYYERTVSALTELVEKGYEPEVPGRLINQLEGANLEGETPIDQLLTLSKRVKSILDVLIGASPDGQDADVEASNDQLYFEAALPRPRVF